MECKAKAKWQRISARKVRRIADLVRGKTVQEAMAILKFMPHKGADLLLDVVKSALANATHNFKLKEEGLKLSQVEINDAPMLKRIRPRARGRAFPRKKRSCHIIVALASQGDK